MSSNSSHPTCHSAVVNYIRAGSEMMISSNQFDKEPIKFDIHTLLSLLCTSFVLNKSIKHTHTHVLNNNWHAFIIIRIGCDKVLLITTEAIDFVSVVMRMWWHYSLQLELWIYWLSASHTHTQSLASLAVDGQRWVLTLIRTWRAHSFDLIAGSWEISLKDTSCCLKERSISEILTEQRRREKKHFNFMFREDTLECDWHFFIHIDMN